ncbi:hypothetical protein ACX0HA_09980 [Flavobacterium hauense]
MKLIIISLLILFCSCSKESNHIEEYDVDIQQLKTLSDNFYAYRGGKVYIHAEKYMIWFNLDWKGDILNVFTINGDSIRNEIPLAIARYKIDTLKLKNDAQHFIDLSHEFRFGHIHIDHKNKIAFSHIEGLTEQYVMPFNDSIKNEYIKKPNFMVLPNGWFVNTETTHR